jgi:hypothetical protein
VVGGVVVGGAVTGVVGGWVTAGPEVLGGVLARVTGAWVGEGFAVIGGVLAGLTFAGEEAVDDVAEVDGVGVEGLVAGAAIVATYQVRPFSTTP